MSGPRYCEPLLEIIKPIETTKISCGFAGRKYWRDPRKIISLHISF
jgi:hypothetical protein